jgi:polyisoprenyl-phosphate glycosyltransferase
MGEGRQSVNTGVGGPAERQLLVVLPVFNDWPALSALLDQLDEVLATHSLRADVLLVDDASTDPFPATFGAAGYHAVGEITVLRLRCNLGHQRAIAVGLAYVHQHVPCDAVVLMDADGEDAPSDLPALIGRCEREGFMAIVFAERRKRVESLLFRAFYHAYRGLHRLLTGHGIRVGNFSIIPRVRLEGLVAVSELWNHYAAAVVRSRQPFVTLPTARSKRLDGRSHMNFVGLVVHGMSAISVYDDVVFVRSIVAALVLAALSVAGLGIVLAVRLFTDIAVPGWATFTSGLLLLVLLQAAMFVASLTFLGLSSRRHAPFVPSREFVHFVATTRVVWSRALRHQPS